MAAAECIPRDARKSPSSGEGGKGGCFRGGWVFALTIISRPSMKDCFGVRILTFLIGRTRSSFRTALSDPSTGGCAKIKNARSAKRRKTRRSERGGRKTSFFRFLCGIIFCGFYFPRMPCKTTYNIVIFFFIQSAESFASVKVRR